MEFERMTSYLARLEANNNRPWFHENHRDYELALEDFRDLVSLIRFKVADAAEDLRDSIMFLEPKEFVYRVPRDMRYSRAEEPYNPSFRAHISKYGRKMLPAGYYFMVQPGGRSGIGCGLYAVGWRELTNAMRDHIAEYGQELQDILEAPGFSLALEGPKLKRMPAGYDETHPQAELIKYKAWSLWLQIPDAELTTFESFALICENFIGMAEPFRRFVNDAVRDITPV